MEMALYSFSTLQESIRDFFPSFFFSFLGRDRGWGEGLYSIFFLLLFFFSLSLSLFRGRQLLLLVLVVTLCVFVRCPRLYSHALYMVVP